MVLTLSGEGSPVPDWLYSIPTSNSTRSLVRSVSKETESTPSTVSVVTLSTKAHFKAS